MFQSFEDRSDGQESAARICALRAELKRLGVDGFIIPRADEFQGEYVAAYAERLCWLTGFSGSAGLAIVLADQAALFVDGRYTLQAPAQTDPEVVTTRHLADDPPAAWLEKILQSDQVVGFDPWLMTAAQVKQFSVACAAAGASLKPMDANPVDAVWRDQPERPKGQVFSQPQQFAGRGIADKLEEASRALAELKAGAAVLTLPDSVSWLFNIRGLDIPHTPVALAYAIVRAGKPAELFLDQARVPEDVAAQLSGTADLRSPAEFEPALAALDGKVLIDPASAPERVRILLEAAGAEILHGKDPCVFPKARKNPTEVEGARAAHRRDGAAMARFLAWLDREAPKGGLDEIAAAQALEGFRAASGELKDVSFDTISGAGPHAAIPHYRVTTGTNRRLEPGAIYLVDSGGQYQDGTTDITRTVIIGEATAEMRDRFTRVLKGMINLSRARFPAGTTGGHLDALARQALWQAGLDFDHGTGHGVGSYLSVHEGPARFSKADSTKLETGMILSNEPGYYKAGDFGIRIENLLAVREPEAIEGGERPMHWFETLVLCPIDRRLIEPQLLDDAELDWLNDYHARVAKEIGPMLEGEDLLWLETATAAISRET